MFDSSLTTIPMEPPWPWMEDLPRIEQSRTRLAMVLEDWEKPLSEFLEKIWGPEKRGAVGIVDTGWNLLASFAAQMSRPGLYSERPTIHCPDAGLPINQLLDRALWTTQQQFLEYLTRGLGDMFVRPHVDEVGRLTLRQVYPHRVYVLVDVNDPDRAAFLAELRLRHAKALGWCWVWEVYDCRDPEEPTFEVRPANGQLSGDWKSAFMPVLGDDPYPWRYSDGTPFIPYIHYRSHATGQYWATSINRGLQRASFHGARLNNTTLYAADAASMPITLLFNGMVAEGVSVQAARAGGEVRTVTALPGSLIPIMPIDGDKAVQGMVVSAATDVLALFQVNRAYALSVFAQHGLRGEDVTRNEGNPTSAAALSISDSSRREEQRRLKPLFAPADQELCRQVAAMARIQAVDGLDGLPDGESVYIVEHHEIPLSAGELQALRDDLEYQRERGLISDLDIYLRLHPGVPRDVARLNMARARAEQAEIDRMAQGGESTGEMDAAPGTASRHGPHVGVLVVQGYRILIEVAAGQVRRGVDPQGKAWAVTMPAHYGEIDGTMGDDGEPVDAFVGPVLDADTVYVAQILDVAGEPDEVKVVFGVRNRAAARQLLDEAYPGLDIVDSIKPVPALSLLRWLAERPARMPSAPTVSSDPPTPTEA